LFETDVKYKQSVTALQEENEKLSERVAQLAEENEKLRAQMSKQAVSIQQMKTAGSADHMALQEHKSKIAAMDKELTALRLEREERDIANNLADLLIYFRDVRINQQVKSEKERLEDEKEPAAMQELAKLTQLYPNKGSGPEAIS
jgi:septal ring factor EnvC (AmiA/AmiB activator)